MNVTQGQACSSAVVWKNKKTRIAKPRKEEKRVMTSKYDSIMELDEEVNGGRRLLEMSVENYMKPPPFWELGGSIKEEEEDRYVPSHPIKCANGSNRIRVKNIRTGVLIEFSKLINAARFVGTTTVIMRRGFGSETARVYRVGEEEYVFEYGGVERPLEEGSGCRFSLDGVVVAVTGEGLISFPSCLSLAKHFGLLVGHILEEKRRKLARKYVLGKETFYIEFDGKKRQKDGGRGIHCHWKGIYDGDWEKIRDIEVTYGKPIRRDDSY